ncbi:MAG: SDR family NAD(P)-dependent oxidoreductase [Sphaerochaeta sp.]|nr:SDR family NAD(P)-dependent oxidoreductase [Sphaerochaeta sp.]
MKYILITGAAGGLGRSVADELAKQGHMVFALDLQIEGLPASDEHIIPIQADITDRASLMQAKEVVLASTSGLDAIINLAGVFAMHALIEMDPALIERTLSVNLMGTIQTNQVFFDLLTSGRARIINCSSEVGRFPSIPFNGAYTISKKALEAYNDTLRRELGFLGYKVIKMQCGSFRTAMHTRTQEQFLFFKGTTKLYGPTLKLLSPILEWEMKHVNDTKHLDRAMTKALEAKRPKKVYRVKNSFLLSLLTLFGEGFTDLVFLMLGRLANASSLQRRKKRGESSLLTEQGVKEEPKENVPGH